MVTSGSAVLLMQAGVPAARTIQLQAKIAVLFNTVCVRCLNAQPVGSMQVKLVYVGHCQASRYANPGFIQSDNTQDEVIRSSCFASVTGWTQSSWDESSRRTGVPRAEHHSTNIQHSA